MKWAIYLIRHKDSKAGKDLYVGHLAYGEGKLGKTLKERLLTHKQLAEERGGGNEAGFKLHKRIFKVGPENWIIKPLASTSTNDEVVELEEMTRALLRPDLNDWVLPEF